MVNGRLCLTLLFVSGPFGIGVGLVWSTPRGRKRVSILGQSQNYGDRDNDVLASSGISHPNKQALVNISIVIFSYFVWIRPQRTQFRIGNSIQGFIGCSMGFPSGAWVESEQKHLCNSNTDLGSNTSGPPTFALRSWFQKSTKNSQEKNSRTEKWIFLFSLWYFCLCIVLLTDSWEHSYSL